MNDYLIFETENFTVSQIAGYRVPGYVIVESKAECTALADYNEEQTVDLAQCLANAEALVQEVVAPERIYVMKFGEQNPRIHFHVFPRTERIGNAYAAQVQDEKPYSGARLVDWVWSHHGSLGFTDAELREFVEQARACSSRRDARAEGASR